MARSPAQIVLHFDQQVRNVSSTVEDAHGASVMSAPAHTAASDVRTLVLPLKPHLPDGDYTVRWQIVSTDGHIISGVFAIGVGSGRPPPQAAAVQGSSLDWSFLIARFAYFCGLALLVGGVTYRLAVWRPVAATVRGQPAAMADLRERIRATQLFTAAAVLMLAGGWVALTQQGAEVAGVSFWEAFDHRGPVASAIQATRFGREFGRGIDLAAVFCVCVAGAFAVARRSRAGALALAVPGSLLGVWTVIVPGLSGHAGDPGRGVAAIAVDAVHVAAAAVWIGGLGQLVLVTPHATRGLVDGERDRVRRAVLGRFSTIALGSVGVIALSGAVRALWEVGSIPEIWTTGYGRTLVVKSALFAGLIGLGYRNRRALDRFGAVRRRAVAELLLLAGVLGAVSLLTDLPPANAPGLAAAAPAGPRGGPAQLTLARGVRLAVWPGRAGANFAALDAPVKTARVTALVGGSSATLRRAPDGTYVGVLPRLSAGRPSILFSAGTHTWAATVSIGPAQRLAQPAVTPTVRGPVAAAEANDVAVGLQRSGPDAARVTLLAQSGAGMPAALVLVRGRVAVPCAGVQGVCYQVPVPPDAAELPVEVRRPARAPVHTRIDLPSAHAPPGTGLLRDSTRRYRALHSLRALNVLSSGPGHSVTTLYTVQAPDRLAYTVRGGAQARIIGSTRWDRQPGQGWVRSSAVRSRLPDPFWEAGARAVYRAGGDRTTVQLTLAVPGGPTFFRLWIDRATHQVERLRMITAAHFMSEREYDQNHAPPVLPPAGAG